MHFVLQIPGSTFNRINIHRHCKEDFHIFDSILKLSNSKYNFKSKQLMKTIECYMLHRTQLISFHIIGFTIKLLQCFIIKFIMMNAMCNVFYCCFYWLMILMMTKTIWRIFRWKYLHKYNTQCNIVIHKEGCFKLYLFLYHI